MFDYIPFPSFTHTTGMTHFLALLLLVQFQTHDTFSEKDVLTLKFCGPCLVLYYCDTELCLPTSKPNLNCEIFQLYTSCCILHLVLGLCQICLIQKNSV